MLSYVFNCDNKSMAFICKVISFQIIEIKIVYKLYLRINLMINFLPDVT